MHFKDFAKGFVVYFALVFVVSAAVGTLYGLIAHGHGALDWEGSLRFGLILGIALPLAQVFKRKNKS
jgi:hypothetical protein